MGAGSTKFGVPTNPRVELADSQTKHIGKRMEIDTPSIIKLDHGTIRYREPEDHRKPILPRLMKPAEAPHEGKDRVGKCGYFYHPKLTDFSKDARYTKEDASRFHYVHKTPAGAGGKKVFFVMGVGMPDEMELPKKSEEISREVTIIEDLDGENVNENEPKVGNVENNKENMLEPTDETKEENAENIDFENKPEDSPEELKESETSLSEPEKSESPSKSEETRDPKMDNVNEEKKIELNKEFRGPLIPRVNIPQVNELPVKQDRTPIICRVRNQIYYNLVFSAPVIVNPELTTSRTNLFLGSKPDVKVESQEENKEGETSGEVKDEEERGEEVPRKSIAKDKDGFSIDILAESNPPTLGIEFERKTTTAQLKKCLGDKLEIQPNKINILHEDKYITSQRLIADFYVGEVQEGYRHRIVLSPM